MVDVLLIVFSSWVVSLWVIFLPAGKGEPHQHPVAPETHDEEGCTPG